MAEPEAKAPTRAKTTAPPKSNPAAELLKKKWTKEHKKALEEARRTAEENQFFLHCPRDFEHHAAYLTEDPGNREIHPGMWFNIEHPTPGDPWFQPFISCQECLASGDTRRWNVALSPARLPDGNMQFRLAADRKYVVGKVSRKEYEERRKDLMEDETNG